MGDFRKMHYVIDVSHGCTNGTVVASYIGDGSYTKALEMAEDKARSNQGSAYDVASAVIRYYGAEPAPPPFTTKTFDRG